DRVHARQRSTTHRVAWKLEDGSLAPDAPDLPERVAHLAECRVRPRGLDEQRHQVLALAGRGLLELRQRPLDLGRVAAPPKAPDPLDLLPLERRVDPKDLQLGL